MTKRAAEDADYIGVMLYDGLSCHVWVDRFVGGRMAGARKHLPTFVEWWRQNGDGRREMIYHTGLPMAVLIEAGT